MFTVWTEQSARRPVGILLLKAPLCSQTLKEQPFLFQAVTAVTDLGLNVLRCPSLDRVTQAASALCRNKARCLTWVMLRSGAVPSRDQNALHNGHQLRAQRHGNVLLPQRPVLLRGCAWSATREPCLGMRLLCQGLITHFGASTCSMTIKPLLRELKARSSMRSISTMKKRGDLGARPRRANKPKPTTKPSDCWRHISQFSSGTETTYLPLQLESTIRSDNKRPRVLAEKKRVKLNIFQRRDLFDHA